jgi:hypothetical protein
MSDCPSGATCFEGACRADVGEPGDASDVEASAPTDARPDTAAVDSARPPVDAASDADAAPILDASTDAPEDATDF